jgi:beta-glucanase (GH16 family)
MRTGLLAAGTSLVLFVVLQANAQHRGGSGPPKPVPKPAPAPPPPAKLLFASEFDTADDFLGAAPKWKTSWPLGSGVNSAATAGEVEIYVDVQNGDTTGPSPFSQGQSMLCISATPTAGLPAPYTYTSGCLSTYGLFTFQYGYTEIRCMAPKGSGFWPVFELFKQPFTWPPEIDIFQYSSRDNTEYYPAVLYTSGSGRRQTTVTAGNFISSSGVDLSAAMHVYGFEWTSSLMNWYFDGTLVMTQKVAISSPMWLTLNLGVGDDAGWIGPPDGSTAQWWIDYVRVYDKKPQ